MPWSRYFDLSDPAEVGQAIRMEAKGREVYRMIQQFPRFEMEAQFQPISQTLIRVELLIQPKFEWNREVHGNAETFLLVVEDSDGDKILYSDTFVLREKYAQSEHVIDFAVPLSDPLPPNYFVSLISEKWLHSETKIALLFNKLHLPAKFPAHTPLLDIEPVPVSELKNPEYEEAFPFSMFNAIQSQAFHALYRSEDNVFIGAATGNGKTVCAELAFLKYWDAGGQGKILYLNPFQEQIESVYVDWNKRFGQVNGGVSLAKASGDLSADLAALAESDILLATPDQWDLVGRKWRKKKQGKFVQRVELVVADEVQMVGGLNGAVYEQVLSRMRLMAAQLEADMRVVALSVPLANGRDIAEWLGAKGQAIFNFSPNERVNFPLKVRLSSFTIPHHPSLMISMARPTYSALIQSNEQKAVVFVNDRRQCVESSYDIIRLAQTDGRTFLGVEITRFEKHLARVQDPFLKDSLAMGVGLYYSSMVAGDRKLVETLFDAGMIRLLIASIDTCWYCPPAELVVIMGTQFYEGREHRYLDYPISDLLQAVGKSRANVLVLTNATKRDYYHKFLSDALPIQSHMHEYLADALVSEISEKVIQSPENCMDWLTYTLFYRLLNLNPSFYGLEDVSADGLSEYLSDLIDTTLKELDGAKIIDRDEEDNIEPLNNAFIAAHYGISFITMQIFVASLTAKTRTRGILDVVSSSTEYESLPMRTHEEIELAQVYRRQKYTLAEVNYDNPSFKAFTLLQAHMSRTPLSPDLVADKDVVLKGIVKLLSATVDILSSEGYLNALNAIDLCQRIVQGIQDKDSPLMQIPYFTAETVSRCQNSKITNVYDFMEIVEDDDLRNSLLGFDDEDPRMAAVADFVNKYPNVDISAEIASDKIYASEPARLRVHLTRHDLEDDEEADVSVAAHRYPYPKRENWWIVVGNEEKRQLYGIKSVSILRASQDVNIDFIAPVAGSLELKVWCLCDSYVGVDKEIPENIRVEVIPGEEDAEMNE
jgi:pre-mRNA-splicing helicase BRR2